MSASSSLSSDLDSSGPAPAVGRTAEPIPAAQHPRRWGIWLLAGAAVAGVLLYVRRDLLVAHEPPAADTVARDKPAVGAVFEHGALVVAERCQQAIGLTTTTVGPQIEPMNLELLGTTKYDEDRLSKVRMMFRGRVEKVYAVMGQQVKLGEPLVDLYSTELADAKSSYEIEFIQWQYDKNLLATREALRRTNAIPEQLYLETQNSELRNRHEFEVARDKLLVYGLTEKEVEGVKDEYGQQKARMTLRAPADGIVIERDVVPGNLYDENDTLLVIAPLDHLWVWGNVFESDLDLVQRGQSWEIQFPFLTERLSGQVEYISNRVDPGTRAVRIRTSIPNPEARLKSDMLVRGRLAIPPKAGRTVIPRTALVVEDGAFFVFVQRPASTVSFERRSVDVAQEKDDHVVIETGLKVGEHVVSTASLILAQLYDDLQTAKTGAPKAIGAGTD